MTSAVLHGLVLLLARTFHGMNGGNVRYVRKGTAEGWSTRLGPITEVRPRPLPFHISERGLRDRSRVGAAVMISTSVTCDSSFFLHADACDDHLFPAGHCAGASSWVAHLPGCAQQDDDRVPRGGPVADEGRAEGRAAHLRSRDVRKSAFDPRGACEGGSVRFVAFPLASKTSMVLVWRSACLSLIASRSVWSAQGGCWLLPGCAAEGDGLTFPTAVDADGRPSALR